MSEDLSLTESPDNVAVPVFIVPEDNSLFYIWWRWRGSAGGTLLVKHGGGITRYQDLWMGRDIYVYDKM